MTSPNPQGSGDGSRPTTDGGTDNIGAAGSFTPGQTNDDSGPAPKEKMSDLRRADPASARGDDSAPLGLEQSPDSTPNTEPPEDSPGRS